MYIPVTEFTAAIQEIPHVIAILDIQILGEKYCKSKLEETSNKIYPI